MAKKFIFIDLQRLLVQASSSFLRINIFDYLKMLMNLSSLLVIHRYICKIIRFLKKRGEADTLLLYVFLLA